MSYRPSPYFVITLIAIAILSASLYIIGAVYFWQAATSQELPSLGKDYRPNISHCFEPDETRELWDCIRHKEAT